MASTLTPEGTPVRLSLLAALPALPFGLDISAPVAIPANRRGGDDTAAWPHPVAGPIVAPEETLDAFIKRRYYETLYLGETLSPLAGFVADLERAGAAHTEAICGIVAQHILGLSAIEARHRRVMGPAVAAVLASGGSSASAAKVEEAFRATGLEEQERGALNAAVEVRVKARAVVEGEKSILPRQITEEFERREVLIQAIFLLVYRAHPHPPPPKKRKRRKDKQVESKPEDDTDAALELLADRISVWAAVAELGIGESPAVKKRPHQAAETVTSQLKMFWDTVLVPNYIPREVTFCTSFHLKVFGTPIPPYLIPQKKPRKPAVTHKLDLETRKISPKRPPAAAPVAPATRAGPSLRRSNSRVEPENRSRSSSTNPPEVLPARRIMRAPSGGIKMREVSFRRSNSMAKTQAQSQSQIQSQSSAASTSFSQSGLLGRNLKAEGKPPAGAVPNAPLILATPAKKTYNIFAPRHQPTPIQEEPSSQASYAADTPHKSSVPETPFGTFGIPETPMLRYGHSPRKDLPSFEELMEPTDDEDDSLIPETPRR